MRAYKILRREGNDRLVSLFAEGEAQVEYFVGRFAMAPKWLRKKKYHLMVFETERAAREYIVKLKRAKRIEGLCIEIWEVEVEGIKWVPLLASGLNCLKVGEFCAQGIALWPEGTIMARKVKLIRKVWPDVGEDTE